MYTCSGCVQLEVLVRTGDRFILVPKQSYTLCRGLCHTIGEIIPFFEFCAGASVCVWYRCYTCRHITPKLNPPTFSTHINALYIHVLHTPTLKCQATILMPYTKYMYVSITPTAIMYRMSEGSAIMSWLGKMQPECLPWRRHVR